MSVAGKRSHVEAQRTIWHIIDSDGIYGAEMMLLNLMEEQARSGLKSVLVSIGERGEHEKDIEKAARGKGLSVLPFRMKRGYSFRSARRLLRMADEEGVSILHSHGYKGNILIGTLPRWYRKIPMMRTLHGWTATRRGSKLWVYEMLDKCSLRTMDAVIRVNSSTGPCLGRTGESGKNSHIIENGIPLLTFDPESVKRSDPAIRDFCRDGFVIGVISRLSEEKGLVHLVEALRKIALQRNGWKAVIIGEGPQRDVVQRMIDEAALSKQILLAGYREQAWRYLPLFDVFVLPSLTEGLPLVILEAMQAKVPIVASNVGGIPGVLERGTRGLLVPPGDPDALAGAIMSIRSDSKKAQILAAAAFRAAREQYTSRRMAEEYQHVYDALLGKDAA